MLMKCFEICSLLAQFTCTSSGNWLIFLFKLFSYQLLSPTIHRIACFHVYFQWKYTENTECVVKNCIVYPSPCLSPPLLIPHFCLLSSLQWDPRTVCWRSPSGPQYLQWSATLQHLNQRCLQLIFPCWAPLTHPAMPSHLPTGLWEVL